MSGVEVQTEKVWEAAEEFELPRLVVAQPDRPRARQPRPRRSSRCTTPFGRTVVPVQLPIGEEKAFRGVVDLVGDEGVTSSRRTAAASSRKSPCPADMEADATAAREALIEMVAEADDKLMEKFFEAGTLTQEELVAGLRTAVARPARSSRCFCTSSALNIGIQPLLDAILDLRAVARRAAGRRQRRAARKSTVSAGDARPVRRVRLEDDRRPVRRPHHDVPRDDAAR